MKDECNKYTAKRAQSRPLRASFILHPSTFILSLFLLSSCSSLPEMPWAPVARDAKAGFYDTARIEYRLDAGKLGQPLDVIRVHGRQVAYEQIASSPLADQSLGTLVIEYPHPGGLPEMARVTFSLDSGQPKTEEGDGWNPFHSGKPVEGIETRHEEIHEVWAMNIPRAESDRYFELLSTQNFYHAEPIETGPAELTVTIDGRQLSKHWEQIPQLDMLVRRVRGEGQLVGYLRPEALTAAAPRTIASTRAYRELLAQATGERATAGRQDRGAIPSPAAAGPRTARLPDASP